MNIFKVKHEPYKHNSTFGLEQCKELCKLIGAELIMERRYYGSFTAKFKDKYLNITRHRSIDRFDIRMDYVFFKSIKIKTLTQRQVTNLINKLNLAIEKDKERTSLLNYRSSIVKKLADHNINVNQLTISYNDFCFYLKDHKLVTESRYEIGRYNCYLSYKNLNQTIETIENIKKDYLDKRKDYLIAIEHLKNHIKLIKSYYWVQQKITDGNV